MYGVYTYAQLLGEASPAEIRRAVADGMLLRLRRGWFATAGAHEHVAQAVRSGGALSCVSALELLGVWVPEGFGSGHVRYRRAHGGPKSAGCHPHGENPPIRCGVDDLDTAVRCAARCVDAETLVVLLDSILHLRLASSDQLERMLRAAPKRVRTLLLRCDRSEAGTETMARLRLRARGIGVRTQVQVTERHRVDLLIGDRLIIECDSRAHHSSWEQQQSDRQRDRELVALGYIVIRLTYAQVCFDWPSAEQDILAVIRSGRHRWRRGRSHI